MHKLLTWVANKFFAPKIPKELPIEMPECNKYDTFIKWLDSCTNKEQVDMLVRAAGTILTSSWIDKFVHQAAGKVARLDAIQRWIARGNYQQYSCTR